MKDEFVGTGIKTAIMAAGAAFTVYFGKLLIPLVILIAVMLLDYGTGMTKAYLSAELSSKIGWRGIIKKLCYFIVVAIAMCCDWLIETGLSSAGVNSAAPVICSAIVICWLIINEMLSILENLTAIGVPMPAFLGKLIKKMKVSVEKKAEEGIDKEEEQHEES